MRLLAGNAVIAKVPSQGDAWCLTVAHALMAHRHLLPAVDGAARPRGLLATSIPVVATIRFGHPLASTDDELPALDFGPLLSTTTARELDGSVQEALRRQLPGYTRWPLGGA